MTNVTCPYCSGNNRPGQNTVFKDVIEADNYYTILEFLCADCGKLFHASYYFDTFLDENDEVIE